MPTFLNRSAGRFALRLSDWLLHPSYRSQRLLESYRTRVAAIIIFLLPCMTITVDFLQWLISMSGVPISPFSYAALAMCMVALFFFRWTTVSPFLVSMIFVVILRGAGLISAFSKAKGTGSPEFICFPMAIVLTFLLLDRLRATYVCLFMLGASIALRWLEHSRTGQVWILSPADYKSETEIFVFFLTVFVAVCLFAYSHLYSLTMKEFQQEQEHNLFLLKMEGLADLAFNFSMQCKPHLQELRSLQGESSRQINRAYRGAQITEQSDQIAITCKNLAKIARSFVHFSHPVLSRNIVPVDFKEVLKHVETMLASSLSQFHSTLRLEIARPIEKVLSRQSPLVLMIATVVQHEIQKSHRDIRIRVENRGDDQVLLQIVAEPREGQERTSRAHNSRSNVFLELIKDLRTQSASEVFFENSQGSARYSVYLKRFGA